MKKYLLLFFAGLFIFNASKAQTFVSGGIYSNTTWTSAGSPYILTDTVVVFSGVTLTIQPGVIVKFNSNALIEIRGNLYANGTATDSIIFTSNSGTPYEGIYNGIQISSSDTTSFRFCRFSYATASINVLGGIAYTLPITHCLFISDLAGITGYYGNNHPPIDSCIFKYDTVGITQPFTNMISVCEFLQNGTGIYELNGPLLNCTFRNNNYGIYFTFTQRAIAYSTFDSNRYYGITYGSDSVINCSIKYNGVGLSGGGPILLNDISDNTIGIELSGGGALISCNTICSNTLYSIYDDFAGNISVSNNYWCLPDSAHIQATIYDAYQNISLGFVYFTPFDTVACTHLCNLSLIPVATNTLVCVGDSTKLKVTVTDPDPIYTAVWNPGSHNGTTYKVAPLVNTTYTVVVTDSSGCKDSAYITIKTTTGPAVSITPLPAKICWNATPLNLTGNPSGGTFSGSGVSGNILYAASANGGQDIITYKYTSSCGITYAFDTIFIEAKAAPPQICYVKTDTSCLFNTVVWQKVGLDTLSIDSILILRQNVIGNYVAIGKVSVHAPTEYNDFGARPLVEPSFYKLGVIDSCTNDTAFSNFNETVFLQSVSTGPSSVNLSWNFYQGNPVVYYRILRDDSGTSNWHAIDSVQGTINSYVDRSAPVNPRLRYLLSTDWNVVCTPFFVVLPRHSRYTFNPNAEYSNVTKVFPTGIQNIADNNFIKIYPNPVNEFISIEFSKTVDGLLKINDVLGQNVYSTNVSGEKGSIKTINLTTLSPGVYFITIEGNGTLFRTKIIKI